MTGSASYSPEWDFLLACCRPPRPFSRQTICQMSRAEFDWPVLLQTAHAHDVLPLLVSGITRLKTQLAPEPLPVPPPVMTHLERAQLERIAWNLMLSSELSSVLATLERAGIRALPFKGPALAMQAHGDLHLRAASDLDIFVPRAHALAASRALLDAGYTVSPPAQRHDARFLRKSKDMAFFRSEATPTVEIHWAFTAPEVKCRLDTDSLWLRLAPLAMPGFTTSCFEAEDLLLILSIHGARHCWERLKWISDIAAIVSSRATVINWSRAVERAAAAGCKRMLLLGISLAVTLLGTEMPPELASHVDNDRVLNRLTAQLTRSLLAGSRLTLAEYYALQLDLREHLRDRLPVLLEFLRGRLRPLRNRKILRASASRAARLLTYSARHGFSPVTSILKAFTGLKS